MHPFPSSKTNCLKKYPGTKVGFCSFRNRWSLSTLEVKLKRTLQAKCWVTQLSWLEPVCLQPWADNTPEHWPQLSGANPKETTFLESGRTVPTAQKEVWLSLSCQTPFEKAYPTGSSLFSQEFWEKIQTEALYVGQTRHRFSILFPLLAGRHFSFCLLQKLELDHVPGIPKRWKSVTEGKTAKEVM